MAPAKPTRKTEGTLSFQRTPARRQEPETTAMDGVHRRKMYGREEALKNNL